MAFVQNFFKSYSINENHRPISFINVNVKVLNKTSSRWIQHSIIKMDIIPTLVSPKEYKYILPLENLFMLQMLLLLLSHFSCVRLCATHRWQTTRLPRPWDSPDKNTGVGCHFLFQCMKMKSESHEPRDCSLPGSSVHGIFQARVLEWGAIAFSGYKRYSDAIQMLYSFMYFP